MNEYWLEAESSKHKVGGEQKETKEEREDALQRGKATSEVIGIKAMGTRFNVLMTIQIPLMQKPVPKSAMSGFGLKSAMYGFGGGGNWTWEGEDFLECCSSTPMACASMPMVPEMGECGEADEEDEELCAELEAEEEDEEFALDLAEAKSKTKAVRTCPRLISPMRPRKGTASAARVSRGNFYAKHKGLSVTAPKRNSKEHVTVTCVLYNTVLGGVPTAADVLAAVEDMEKLFAACTESGRLADAAFDFMKKELTVADMVKIVEKVTTQKPVAPPPPPLSPTAVSPPNVPRDVVLAKVGEVEGMKTVSGEKVLELRLLTLGAMDDVEVKTLLGSKFDSLKSKIDAGDGDGTRAMLLEIKLLIQGALN